MDTKLMKKDLDIALKNLAAVIDRFDLKSISIIKDLDIFNSPQALLYIERLIHYLGSKKILATFYHDNLPIPPVHERQRIIQQYHEPPMMGHRGYKKCLQKISEDFYWRHIRDEVLQFVRSCPLCQKSKNTRVKTRLPMLITPTPTRPFFQITIDLHGVLPLYNNFSWILTVVDLLTKYFIAVPLHDSSATEVAKALVNNVISIYGIPRIISSDQGSHFCNKVIQGMSRIFKIEKLCSTAFHPESQGSVERSHSSLIEYLKMYMSDCNDWPEWLPLACFSFNTSCHESSGYSPYELLYGRKPIVPSIFPPREQVLLYDNYLADMCDKLREIQFNAQCNMIQNKYKSKEYYDKKCNPVHFSPGNEIYLVNNRGGNKHSKSSYLGPFFINDIDYTKRNVEIQHEKIRKVVHMNLLKKAYEARHPSNSCEKPTEENTDWLTDASIE